MIDQTRWQTQLQVLAGNAGIDPDKDIRQIYVEMLKQKAEFKPFVDQHLVRLEEHLGQVCPSCREDRQSSCRCGWTPGLCLSCAAQEDLGDGYCDTCFPDDGSSNR
jgi:hypothetical protein